MKRLGLSALFWFMVFLLMMASLLMVALSYNPAKAQDIGITVCRDPYLESPRFEFHNLPAGWEDGSVGWWALYEGGSFEDGVLIADAYTDNENPDLIGTATVGSLDYSIEVRGDANTPDCATIAEPTLVSASMPVVSTEATVHTMSTIRACTVKYPQIILVCRNA